LSRRLPAVAGEYFWSTLGEGAMTAEQTDLTAVPAEIEAGSGAAAVVAVAPGAANPEV
jgi:hypothetical protein